jgi:hypothetical protein
MQLGCAHYSAKTCVCQVQIFSVDFVAVREYNIIYRLSKAKQTKEI